MKACEFGFNFAQNIGAEVVLLHVYFTPIYATSLPYGDVFNYQLSDEENVRSILQKVHADLNELSDKVKEKVASGEFPDIKYTCVCVKVFLKKRYSAIPRNIGHALS